MNLSEDKIKEMLKERYGKAAQNAGCCGSSSCCSYTPPVVTIAELGKKLDYSNEELSLGMGEANLGLGCGNPISIAEIQEGEYVIDLGCGAGFDAFLAAKRVGKTGKVIGVDMTPEMIEKAKINAGKLAISNIKFHQSEIENMPISDNWADVVISNCVINLAPSKALVFKEIFRVLKPGGRISISDVLRSGEIPEHLKTNLEAYAGCIAGAISPDEVKQILINLGFQDISITPKTQSKEIIESWNIGTEMENVVFSAYIKAFKPKK